MKHINWLVVSAAIYILGMIVCFGPATVESEQADRDHDAICAPQPLCHGFGPSVGDGLLKAMFWPLWISYKVAKVPNK